MRPRFALILTFVLAPRVLLAADVGEIALLEDTGGQIQQSVLIGSRYLGRAACAFYQTHEDRYDAIFVFSAIPLSMLARTQQGWALRSAAQGIGRDAYFDTTDRFCSTRLRHAVKMGDIGSFDDDPDAIYTGAFGFTLSGVELMGHEFGHQWLAAVTFDRGDGRHCLLRGFNPPTEPPLDPACDGYRNSDFNQHWSHYFNTGSVMYGNVIEDLGGGQFRLTNPGAKYSELDQYLMGLRDPDEVSPMFLVDVGPLSAESTAFPVARGQAEIVSGERVDFTIEDVIRAEGPRDPAREACHWKAAFIILHEEGSPPTAQEIARVDAYRQRWEEFYAEATDRRGSFDTTLSGTGSGTLECPAAVEPLPSDAGVAPDAADITDTGTPDAAELDASAPDAAPEIERDAGGPGLLDRPEDGVRVLKTADCDCRTSGGATAAPWWPALFLLAACARLRRW